MLRLGRFKNWKSKGEGGTGSRGAVHFYRSIMQFYDPFRDGQTEAGMPCFFVAALFQLIKANHNIL